MINHIGRVRFPEIGNGTHRNAAFSTDQAGISEENGAGLVESEVLISRTVLCQSGWGVELGS